MSEPAAWKLVNMGLTAVGMSSMVVSFDGIYYDQTRGSMSRATDDCVL